MSAPRRGAVRARKRRTIDTPFAGLTTALYRTLVLASKEGGADMTHDQDPTGPCRNCNERPATVWWVGDGGSYAAARGHQTPWCKRCAVVEMLAYARERAAAIPGLEAELAEIDASDAPAQPHVAVEPSQRATPPPGDDVEAVCVGNATYYVRRNVDAMAKRFDEAMRQAGEKKPQAKRHDDA